ncbi:MAG TPA: DUF2127 domain-containing protein [Streptosporangiaceae bacterium]|nr:DUF2127 domain-containing protein [Streptosporangiaceae bacterium]
MDWNLYKCGRAGHITYAPDESQLRAHMHARTGSAELWQCLRCGTYVTGEPHGTGPAAQAPMVKRGKQIRGDLILRLFAIERALRVLLFGVAAYGIWRFASSRLTLTQAINRDVPIVRSLFKQLGFSISHSLLSKVQSLLHVSSTKLTVLAIAVTGLAVVSAIEAFALWQARRWGEYFAMIVTSLGLPFEIYELYDKVTATKATLFILNLILVAYLVTSRRLFGARGGKEAYEARLRSDSVLDEATATATAPAPVEATPVEATPDAPAVPPGNGGTAALTSAAASPATAESQASTTFPTSALPDRR